LTAPSRPPAGRCGLHFKGRSNRVVMVLLKYIIKKLILMIPILIGASIIVFIMIHWLPGIRCT
jgi:hypothetical protein